MNREIFCATPAIYPITGDVLSTAGSSTVRVTGLQGIPIQQIVPPQGSMLEFNINTGQWQPIQRASIQVNGLTVSTDYSISINAHPVSLNGVPIT